MKDRLTNAKLYRMTIHVVDVNKQYGSSGELLGALRWGCEASIHAYNVEMVSIKWDDEIDINRYGSTKDDFDKYFKVNEMTHDEIEEAEADYKLRKGFWGESYHIYLACKSKE